MSNYKASITVASFLVVLLVFAFIATKFGLFQAKQTLNGEDGMATSQAVAAPTAEENASATKAGRKDAETSQPQQESLVDKPKTKEANQEQRAELTGVIEPKPAKTAEMSPTIEQIRASMDVEQTITFRVLNVGGRNNRYLNSLENFSSRNCFTAKVLASQVEALKDLGIADPNVDLMGKVVRVRGMVSNANSRLELVVSNLKEQFQILDETSPEWLAAKKEIESRPVIELPPIVPPPPPSELLKPIPVNGLKVLAWNLESGESSPSVIGEQMKSFADVDLFGFTEVDSSSFGLYLNAIESIDDRNFASVDSKSGERDRLQFVYNKDRLELLESKEPNELAGIIVNPGNVRSPLMCLFLDRVTKQRFYAVVVHQARGNEELRNQQAKALREWARDQSIAVVAMGDFNYDFKIAENRGNVTFEELNRDNILGWVRPETLIETNWTDEDQDLRNDFPDQILDGFFVGGPAKTWQAQCRVIVRAKDFPDDDTTSDHRPCELVIVPQ